MVRLYHIIINFVRFKPSGYCAFCENTTQIATSETDLATPIVTDQDSNRFDVSILVKDDLVQVASYKRLCSMVMIN